MTLHTFKATLGDKSYLITFDDATCKYRCAHWDEGVWDDTNITTFIAWWRKLGYTVDTRKHRRNI